MKKVLVPLAVKSLTENSVAPLHFVRETYINKLVENNLTPVFISTKISKEMVDELYSECDGVLFTGGSDFHSENYGENEHEKLDASERERDKLEIYILKKVLNDKKPFLGICRGCQALAIASGGTLEQHIPDTEEHEVHMSEFADRSMTYEDLVSTEKHRVKIDKNSKAFRILKKEMIETNSAHHQAVKTVGKSLQVVGMTQAGIVEIIEHKEFFCFGLQSHPEAEVNGDLEVFFHKFAEAIDLVLVSRETRIHMHAFRS
jgi:putative glutamine amidotransferase